MTVATMNSGDGTGFSRTFTARGWHRSLNGWSTVEAALSPADGVGYVSGRLEKRWSAMVAARFGGSRKVRAPRAGRQVTPGRRKATEGPQKIHRRPQGLVRV